MSAYAPAVARILNRGVPYGEEVAVYQYGDVEVRTANPVPPERLARLTARGYTLRPCVGGHIISRLMGAGEGEQQ